MTGDGYRVTFNAPGTIDYFCTIHPEMIGTITVTGEASAGGSGEDGIVVADGQLPGEGSPGSLDGGSASAAEGTDDNATAPLVVQGVRVIDNGYDPDTVTIEAGTTVRWSNTGNLPHTVTARDGSYDSGIFESGGAFLQSFDAVGTYEYFCTLHPEMVGTIEVIAAAAPVVQAGVAPIIPTEPMNPLIAFVLAGGMLAVMIAFTIGMSRFGKMADQER
jgi:plastocyanin